MSLNYAKAYRQMLADSNANFFCHTSYRLMAKKLGITKLEAIECMNWLIRNGKIMFIEAVNKEGKGDYLVKYKVNDWGLNG